MYHPADPLRGPGLTQVLGHMTNEDGNRIKAVRTARTVRFIIWLVACACAGVLKSIYGGWQLFNIGIVVVAILLFLGFVVERWIIRRSQAQ